MARLSVFTGWSHDDFNIIHSPADQSYLDVPPIEYDDPNAIIQPDISNVPGRLKIFRSIGNVYADNDDNGVPDYRVGQKAINEDPNDLATSTREKDSIRAGFFANYDIKSILIILGLASAAFALTTVGKKIL